MDNIALALDELNEDLVLAGVKKAKLIGASNIGIMQALNRGMLLVGKRFEDGDYFLADLIMSGLIYRKAIELIGVHQTPQTKSYLGTVLIGVVKNDIHDIGKDIIVSSLSAEGFKVIDLGTDVKTDEFVKAAKKHHPDIIALSGTMSFAKDEIKNTLAALSDAQVRDFSKIIVGGLCISEKRSLEMGADAYSKDPIDAIQVCKELMKK